MKINKQTTAIICLSPNDGGMEIDSIKLANKLSTFVETILISKENSFIEHEMKNNFSNIKTETIAFRKNLSISIFIRTRQIIQKYNIKNIIFFGASELKSLYFAFLGFNINLIIRHGTTKSTQKKDFFHRLIYSNVNYHISICEHLFNNVNYIIPFGKRTKAKIIYSSLPISKQEHKLKKEKHITLLHIGRIAKGKGQIDAIKACKVLYDNNINFTLNLLGSLNKKYENEFLQFYNNCEYKNHIKLIGFTKNIKYYISMSDIFIFPSHGEGLSNAFIESISNNLVCITYNNTSFPELKELGLYFTMANHLDIEDLKEKLLFIYYNFRIEQKKSYHNYELSKELFSLEKEINDYIKILI